MAKWSLNVVTMTPGTGVADARRSAPPALPGFPGFATQYIKVYEMEEQGQGTTAGASNFMVWARLTTVTATPTTLATPNSLGPMDPARAALAHLRLAPSPLPPGHRARRSSLAKLNMSFNAFGGILRWQAAPGCEWGISAHRFDR